MEVRFFESVGHQHQEICSSPRHLVQGPIVPENETWMLKLLSAKNNMNPNQYPAERTTAELSVCVYLPTRPSDHEEPPPGTWVALEGVAGAPQFRPIKWEGYLTLPTGAQLGAWFRGAEEGDVLELNAIFDIEMRL